VWVNVGWLITKSPKSP